MILKKLEQGTGLLFFRQVLEGALNGVFVVAVEGAVEAGLEVVALDAALVSETDFGIYNFESFFEKIYEMISKIFYLERKAKVRWFNVLPRSLIT